MRHRVLFSLALATALSLGLLPREQADAIVLTDRMHHLGDNDTPEWPEAPSAPEGSRLDFTFEATGKDSEGTLLLRQRHVNDAWHVVINGQTVATLERTEALGEQHYTLAPGVLRAGRNTFELVPEVDTDDITVGEIRVYEAPLREVLDLRRVRVRVRNAQTGELVPARVTFADAEDELVPVYYATAPHTAVRTGVVYTATGELVAELPAGPVRVYAARGTEWSMDRRALTLSDGEHTVDLALTRELDTRGFIACDTHVHTLTHSGHGDSSVEERMVTLAAEGVELAIATDHNHNTDYRPTQRAMGLERFFTPVIGNEVTTPVGHFNAFPLRAEDPVPLHDSRDVAAIVADCRAKGAEAVILNHPRWPDHDRGPYGVCGLDHYTGASRGDELPHVYDAVELINSETEEKEPMLLFRDWFALLNAGHGVRGVGSSDSHTVGGVVGQGRTYIASSTDDAAAIDVHEAARNLREGRSSVSMGIVADVRRGDVSVLGETIAASSLATEPLSLRVQAPSWITPRRVEVYANGQLVQETEIERGEAGRPFDRTMALDYREGPGDVWLVCVVHGDGVGGPWWLQLNPYTLAATNPVFIDQDGDLAFTSAREAAAELLARHKDDAGVMRTLLREVDPAVAFHLVQGLRDAYVREAHERALAVGAEAASFQPELTGFLERLKETGATD